MTSSALSPLTDRIDPDTAASAVGGLSVALGALAVLAPSRTAAAFGVRSLDGSVPLLVRMVGVRNAVGGIRTLQADSSDRPKALQAGLALGAVDAAALLLAARRGAITKKAAAGVLVVLAGIALLGVAAAQD
ncbi:hypothetical protein BH24ACT10_BH24ACT10_05250 [soil metagenome]